MRILFFVTIQLVWLCNLVSNSYAQDAQFTQFFAARLWHNPAFTGIESQGSVLVGYRNQWSSLPGSFRTSILSADFRLGKTNHGLGLVVVQDNAGADWLQTNWYLGSYAYHLPISRKWQIGMGLQAGAVIRNFGIGGLVLQDQLRAGGGNSQDPLAGLNQQNTNFALNLAGLAYSDKLWAGISAANIIRQTIAGTDGSVWARRYMASFGMKIPLIKPSGQTNQRNKEPDIALMPAALFRVQGIGRQLDVGCYGQYQNVLAGLWYRGLPVINSKNGIIGQSALALHAGLRWEDFTFGYSYDINLTRIGAGNSHEIMAAYVFGRTSYQSMPCPRF